MLKALYDKIGLFLVFLVGWVLCIKQIKEPDLWWQLRAGEWMLENQELTRTDVFSYTYAGENWINVKWLYEVILASLASFLGPEAVVVLQLISLSVVIFCLIILAKSFQNTSAFYLPASILAILFFLFIHSARINLRPEMNTYMFTAIYFLIFVKYRELKKVKWLYFLIPLQLLWTNLHEAYGVGLVMILSFTLSLIGEWMLAKWKFLNYSFTLDRKVFLPLLLSFFVVVLNPHGFSLLQHNYEIFSQLQSNNYTSELLSIASPLYWSKASVLNMLIFSLSILVVIFKKGKRGWKEYSSTLLMNYGLYYFLLFFAFFYLGLKAQRNAFFFALISFPLYFQFFQLVFFKFLKKEGLAGMAVSMLALIFYLSIVSNSYYKLWHPGDSFGLGVNREKNPIGASNFIKTNQINGYGFVDYFSSSYFLWSLQPEFKSYIDMRDLDIFDESFMSNVMQAHYQPNLILKNGQELFAFMDSIDKFSYVVMLNNEIFDSFNLYMHQNELFDLAYVDGLNSLYLRKIPEHADLINSFQQKQLSSSYFSTYGEYHGKPWTKFLTRVFWPFYQEKEFDQEDYRNMQALYELKFNI
ncbi:MAG: hypothetical protein KDC82_07850 [Bacteroidetes bacterium]|nr:hypothetical protein [Bacteroidota bacterium]